MLKAQVTVYCRFLHFKYFWHMNKANTKASLHLQLFAGKALSIDIWPLWACTRQGISTTSDCNRDSCPFMWPAMMAESSFLISSFRCTIYTKLLNKVKQALHPNIFKDPLLQYISQSLYLNKELQQHFRVKFCFTRKLKNYIPICTLLIYLFHF